MSKFTEKLKQLKWKYYINYVVIAAVTVIFAVLSMTGMLRMSTTVMLEQLAIAIILGISLSLVVGFLGELSLGHAGFMCVGAYLGGKVSALLENVLGNSLPNLAVSLIVGGICAGICGFIIGLPALRLKGDYLAIVTLAFGEIVRTLFQNTSETSFGGPVGLRTPRFEKTYLFIIALVMVLLTLMVVQNLIRSKHGRAITAIRDNEIAAKATGVNVTRYKLTGFIISAIFAGFAGVLYSFSQNSIQSSTFDYNYSIDILVIVVLGGMGNINGTIISAVLITFLNNKLQSALTGELAVLKDIFYSLILILVIIYGNAPGLKAFREKYNLKNLIAKIIRGKHDPSKERDDSGRWDVITTKISMDEILSTDFNNSNDYIKGNKGEK